MEERKKKDIDRDKLIAEYFYRGYPYKAIVSFLEKFHDVQIHERILERRLRQLALKIKRGDYDEDALREVITHTEQEMRGAASLAGYRYIRHSLRLRHELYVPQRLFFSVVLLFSSLLPLDQFLS